MCNEAGVHAANLMQLYPKEVEMDHKSFMPGN